MWSCSWRSVPVVGAVAAALGLPSAAVAGGFAVFEHGARGMGLAGAFTARASDPSAIFHNAAGIAFLEGRQAYAGGTLLAPETTFRGADPFPGAGVTEKGDMGPLLPPAAYYTHQFSDRLVLGMGLNSPFTFETGWQDPDAFSGRFISQLAELKGYSLNPTVAYRLEDRLAVGAGLDVRFSSLTLRRRVAVTDPVSQEIADAASLSIASGTETGIGFNAGVLARPSASWSLGASYRHKVKVDYRAAAVFDPALTGNPALDAQVEALLPAGSVPVTTSIEFPAIASLGVAYTWSDWTVEGDVNWYQWSTFDQLLLVFETRGDLSQALVENYRSSWQYRVGVERPLGRAFTVRGGYYFDDSPAPPASISPLLPDADRQGVAVGGSWKRGRWWVDAAGSLVLPRQRSTLGRNRDRYDGIYESRALTLGVSLGHTF